MGKDKNIPPTIEESLRMIEEKLSKGKKIRKKLNWTPLISIKAGINILLKSVNK